VSCSPSEPKPVSIEALNEDTVYCAVASEAADMDAVRVMTIHGSKGLEFRAVRLPARRSIAAQVKLYLRASIPSTTVLFVS
jgi:superfamily I DNA/RNA helicase